MKLPKGAARRPVPEAPGEPPGRDPDATPELPGTRLEAGKHLDALSA